jgi:hypothetical protein
VGTRTGPNDVEGEYFCSTSKFHSMSGESASGFLLWHPFPLPGLHLTLPYT